MSQHGRFRLDQKAANFCEQFHNNWLFSIEYQRLPGYCKFEGVYIDV